MRRSRPPVSRSAKQFVKALNAAPAGSGGLPPFFTGTVTAVDKSGGTISVQLPTDSSATSGINYLPSYWPSVGDVVILASQGYHWFALGSIFGSAQALPLQGQIDTNIVSGGSNRTGGAPFDFRDSAVVPISGGEWAYDTSGRGSIFAGCGSFHVTPGSDSASLGFCTILASSCSISAGVLTLGGFAQNYNGVNITSGNIQVNVSAIGW